MATRVAQWLLNGDGNGLCDSSSTAMDGATAPRRRGTARARRRWTESTTVMGGNGQHDGELRVMEGAARRQLYGEGRCDSDSTTMDDEELRKRDGDVDVDTAGGGSNKGQHGIKL
jgi:hypothetical protein